MKQQHLPTQIFVKDLIDGYNCQIQSKHLAKFAMNHIIENDISVHFLQQVFYKPNDHGRAKVDVI